MCFRFDSCFGVHVHDDDDYHYGPSRHATDVATTKPTPPAPALRDGGYYGSNDGHRAQQGLHRGNAHHTAAYRHQQPAAHADDKAGGRRKQPSAAPAVAEMMMGGLHGHAASAREQAHARTAGAGEALMRPAPARNDKVAAHGAAKGAQHHHYPAATATSDHERY